MSTSYEHDTGNFGWRVEPDRTVVWVRAWGELDLAHADGLRGLLDELRESGWLDVGIDLRGLSFIDSAGLHVLLEESAHARKRTGTLLVQPGERCERLLSICGITDLNVTGAVQAPRHPVQAPRHLLFARGLETLERQR